MMRTLTTERQMIQFIYSSQFLGIHSLKKCIHNMMYRMNIHTKMLHNQKCLHYSCCGNRKLTKQIIFSDSGKRTCAPVSVSSLYSHENSQNVSQKLLCKTEISGISNTRNWLHFGKQNKPHSNLFHTLQNYLSNRILASEKIIPCPSACLRYYHTRKHLSPLFYNSQTVDQSSTQKLKSPGQHCRHHSSLPDRFVVNKNDIFKQYLDSLVAEFKNINSILSNEAPGEDVNIKKLNSRIVELTPLVSLITELEMVDAHVKELDALLSGLSSTDTEMKNLAESEKEECFKQMEELHMQLIEALVGVEHADKSDIILEVTAGVGGQEAMLFTGEIFNLYRTFAQRKGWSFDIMSSDTSDQGGLRKASASVCGMDVYRLLKFESGVHRVQRCPKTEKSGRIHTSTMTVAVLPQPTEIEVVLQQKDLRIETFRASGKGGQHVNTTDSAVRIVHLPTGTVAECQQERSQIKNKALAMQILRSRIYEKELEEQQMKYKADRKLQVGTAGRSEKIRTYNFPQDRITDHRINYSIFNLSHFMTSGEDLDGLISVLLKESQYQELDGILEDFAKSKKKESA